MFNVLMFRWISNFIHEIYEISIAKNSGLNFWVLYILRCESYCEKGKYKIIAKITGYYVYTCMNSYVRSYEPFTVVSSNLINECVSCTISCLANSVLI